jgi:hypothetical protein
MTARRATICLLTYGDYLAYFRRCLESVLMHTPHDAIELRLGFNDAPISFHYALGQLCPDGMFAAWAALPEGVERFSCTTASGLPVQIWHSAINLYKEPMARLLYHDAPLTTAYAVWFDDDSYVESGWWEGLVPLLDRGIDYIGQPWWVTYLPGQVEMIQAQPWYRGIPFARRNGRSGTSFMTGAFQAIKTACLREANFPDTSTRWNGRSLQQYGGDTLLGEVAHQLGWSQLAHHEGIHVNVDLQGRHPAPRRGGIGRQFGSDVDITIR